MLKFHGQSKTETSFANSRSIAFANTFWLEYVLHLFLYIVFKYVTNVIAKMIVNPIC